MIGYNTSLITSYIDNRKKDKLYGIIGRVDTVEKVLFKDEIAGKMIQALNDIEEYPYRKYKEIQPDEISHSSEINTIISNHKSIINLLYDSVRHIISEANTVSKKIGEANENISNSSASVISIFKKLEVELKSRGRRISIADERIFFDSFNNRNLISSSTLRVDTTSGVAILPINTQIEKPIEIIGINSNMQKLRIKTRNIIRETQSDIIEKGFYAGKFYGDDPRFEPVDASNNHFTGVPKTLLTLAYDGDPYTSLEMEYCTDRYDATFKLDFDIQLNNPGDVQMITISMNNQGNGSNVKVDRIQATYNNYYMDYTNTVYGKGISVGNITLPGGETDIGLTGDDQYPRDNLYLMALNTTGFKLSLSQSGHSECKYPIVRLEDKAGNLIRELNYLESLVVMHKAYKDGYFNVEKMGATYDKIITPQDKNSNIVIDYKSINRYLIAVRDIQAFNIDFGTSGELITAWYDVAEGIAGIELYVDEVIHPSLSVTSIRYFIGINNDFYEIWPSNRRSDALLPMRFTFGDAETDETSKRIGDNYPTSVRLLVRMTGGGRLTPILHSYMIRVKMRTKL